jgi:hypothetical protein
MPADEDISADATAASPIPFVMTHPCAACHGQGIVDGEACPGCHATGAGRFFHGTKADLKPGDVIGVGQRPNFGKLERTTTYVYLTGTLDAATWGAELALGEGPGRIYIVEPTGLIENDPNLTDKKFPGNPTRSYRSRDPLRVKGEVTAWRGHSPEQLRAMKDGLRRAKEQGIEPIDD